jgi:hypothetical protein
MQTTVPLHGTFSAPALPIFRLKAPNQRRLTLDPPKSEIRLGALLLVLLGGQRNVLCSVPDNLDLLARRETGENAPTLPCPSRSLWRSTRMLQHRTRCGPAFLTESQRHFKGLRAIWRRQTRWRSALVCLNKNRAQALSHENEHSTSAPRSYNIEHKWTCASRSNIWLMALLARPLNGL